MRRYQVKRLPGVPHSKHPSGDQGDGEFGAESSYIATLTDKATRHVANARCYFLSPLSDQSNGVECPTMHALPGMTL